MPTPFSLFSPGKNRITGILSIIVLIVGLIVTILIVKEQIIDRIRAAELPTGTLQLLGVRLVRDKDFPGGDTTQKGSRLQLFLRNASSQPIQLTDYSIDGIASTSLPTACNPFRCSQIPDLRWWMPWPNPIPAGGLTTVKIRLVNSDLTLSATGSAHQVALMTDQGTATFTISPKPTNLWIPFVTIAQDMKTLTVYAGNQGTTSLHLPSSNAVKINNEVISYTLPSQDIPPDTSLPITVLLTTALTKGANTVISVANDTGTEQALGSMRALPSNFGVTFWFQDNGVTPSELAKHHIDRTIPFSLAQDEPTGNSVSPQSLANKMLTLFNTSSTPQIVQMSGYADNLYYADMSDISLSHHGNIEEDLSLFLTWPKPIWYLPQIAWGRRESDLSYKESWYPLEDFQKESLQGVGHGAKDIQWFTFPSLWSQIYDSRQEGAEHNRRMQDYYMPGATANPVEWDRLGRSSGILSLLKPYLTDSAPFSRTTDSQGVEINTIITSSPKNVVIILTDQKTDPTFYTQARPVTTQTIFTNITVTAKIPSYLQSTKAYVIDPFKGVYSIPMNRIASDTVSLSLDRLQSAAVIVLGDATDENSLTSAFTTLSHDMADFADIPVTSLSIPSSDVIPYSWAYRLPGGQTKLYDLKISNDGTRILLAHGNSLFVFDNTGKKLWQKTYAGRIFYAVFSKNNDIIYVASDLSPDVQGIKFLYTNSNITAYDLSGQQLWQQKVGPSLASGRTVYDLKPSISDNGVYYTEYSNHVYHLSSTGQVLFDTTTSNNYAFSVQPLSDGGALAVDYTLVNRISSTGSKTTLVGGVVAGASSDGTEIAAGEPVNIYKNGTKIATQDIGRGIRKIVFSPDNSLIAVGSSNGIFTILNASDGSIKWQKIQKDSYITAIQFLPTGGVAFQREYFDYSPTTTWKFRDTIESYDISGNQLWRHEGLWRDNPYMDQFAVSQTNNRMIVATAEELRFVDLTQPTIPNTQISSPPALPSPWKSQDITTTGAQGSGTYTPLADTFSVQGSGGTTSDPYQFTYVPMSGDGQIVTHLLQATNYSSYSTAGLMMRENLAGGAKFVWLRYMPTGHPNNIKVALRTTSGGSVADNWINNSVVAMPMWLKLARSGSTFTSSFSSDGTNWTTAATYTVAMGADISVGMVAHSDNGSATDTNDYTTLMEGVFDHVSVTGISMVSPTPTLHPTNTPIPTSTPIPNSTKFDLTLLLHGIGKGGDNSNPNGSGNNTPIHPTRTVTLELYDSSSTLIKTISGTVTFNPTNGNFTGVIDGGTGITSGAYIAKLRTSPYLRHQVGGIITITTSQTNTLPSVALTDGDANDDNALNILDYNLMLDCYSDLAPAKNCDTTKLQQTDFNDDGTVNQLDYNLFLRELSVQTGQ